MSIPLLTMLTDLMQSSPSVNIPLAQITLFMLLISLAATLAWHRVILFLCYGFLVNWVFINNLDLLQANRISFVTLTVFAVFGVLGLCLTFYHMLTTPTN